MYYHSLTTSLNTVRVLFSTFHTIKKTGSRTEPILTFGSNVTTQNVHSAQLFANTKRVLGVFLFRVKWAALFFFDFVLRSNWHQNQWKWHFFCFVLLFLMIHGASRRLLQSSAASFGVWGYCNRFLRSIMNACVRYRCGTQWQLQFPPAPSTHVHFHTL